MKTLFVNIGIGAAAGAAIFSVIDNLLREKERKWVTDKTSNLWIWLDDQKTGRVLHIYLRDRIQKVARLAIYSLGVLSCLGWIGTILEEKLDIYQVGTFVILFTISMFLTIKYLYPWVVKKLGKTTNIWQYIRMILIGTIASYFVASIISVMAIVPMMFFISENDEGSFMLTITIFFALSPITALFMVFQTLLGLAIVWICFVYLLIRFFKVLGFFSLRLAENPKGPVVAIGGLLGAIGGIIKIFMGNP